jgi:predicted transcriptional regulator
MEVHLSPELQAKVDRAAAGNKSDAEEYDRGEFLTHEEVGARIDQMFRK